MWNIHILHYIDLEVHPMLNVFQNHSDTDIHIFYILYLHYKKSSVYPILIVNLSISILKLFYIFKRLVHLFR